MPDFENYPYSAAIGSVGSQLDAWGKLREAERRMAFYEWIEGQNDPENPHHRVLIRDSVSAFLLTFEATIQFLKTQFEKKFGKDTFDDWFKQQSQYDVYIKGLRTLRHFEAHITSGPISKRTHLHIESGGKEKQISRNGHTWHFLPLSDSDVEKSVRKRPLSSRDDRRQWNIYVQIYEIKAVFSEGLHRLKDILEIAEMKIGK